MSKRDLSSAYRGSPRTHMPMFLGMCWPTAEALAWGAAMLESVPVSDEEADWAATSDSDEALVLG